MRTCFSYRLVLFVHVSFKTNLRLVRKNRRKILNTVEYFSIFISVFTSRENWVRLNKVIIVHMLKTSLQLRLYPSPFLSLVFIYSCRFTNGKKKQKVGHCVILSYFIGALIGQKLLNPQPTMDPSKLSWD